MDKCDTCMLRYVCEEQAESICKSRYYKPDSVMLSHKLVSETDKGLISREEAKRALTGWSTDPTDEEIEYTLDRLPSALVTQAQWRYYHKQNIAVCTNCSFERDLDANFGKAVSCPNCGAIMGGKYT